MNQFLGIAMLAAFCFTPQNRSKSKFLFPERSVEPVVSEFTARPVFTEPLVNRWDVVEFQYPPLPMPTRGTQVPINWQSLPIEAPQSQAPEMCAARGNEVPVEWPPRKKPYREEYAVIPDSRVTVERPDRVGGRTHHVAAVSSGQVKFVRGWAVAP
jgi:hypothetical protein